MNFYTVHVHAFKIFMQVNEVKSDLSQIGCDVELIHKMISGLVNCRTCCFLCCSFSAFFYLSYKHPIKSNNHLAVVLT